MKSLLDGKTVLAYLLSVILLTISAPLHDWHTPLLATMCLTPLLWIRRAQTVRQNWIFFSVYFISILWPLSLVGNHPSAIWPTIQSMMGVLWLLKLILPIVFSAAISVGLAQYQRGMWPIACALPWVFIEWILQSSWIQFPLSISLTQSFESPLLPVATWVGGLGISWILLWLNFWFLWGAERLLIESSQPKRLIPQPIGNIAGIILFICLANGYPSTSLNTNTPEPLAIGYINPLLTFKMGVTTLKNPDYFQNYLDKFVFESLELSQNTSLDLLVWPEGTLKTPAMDSPSVIDLGNSLSQEMSCAVLLSGYTLKHHQMIATSQLYLPQKGLVKQISKQHSIPIIEYAPKTTYNRQLPLPNKSLSFGHLLCYESLHPTVYQHMRSADMGLVIVSSSTSFFLTKWWPRLFLATLSIRAAELGKPIVQLSNMGPNAHLDHTGKIIAAASSRTTPSGVFHVKPSSGPPTIYHRFYTLLNGLIISGFFLSLMVLYRLDRIPKAS